MQIVFVKKKKGCKNFMEKQTDSVETVKSIASDLKAVEPIVSVKNLIVTGKDGRLLVDHLSLQLKRYCTAHRGCYDKAKCEQKRSSMPR